MYYTIERGPEENSRGLQQSSHGTEIESIPRITPSRNITSQSILIVDLDDDNHTLVEHGICIYVYISDPTKLVLNFPGICSYDDEYFVV